MVAHRSGVGYPTVRHPADRSEQGHEDRSVRPGVRPASNGRTRAFFQVCETPSS
jgi:hypothetical protein